MNKIKLVKILLLITSLFMLSACSVQSNIESGQTEVDYAEEESIEKAAENEIEEKEVEENDIEEKEKVIRNEEVTAERMTPREALEYMFDYLYPDKSDMVKIVLLDMEGELSYTFYYMESNFSTHEDEISDPCGLYLTGSTEDGLYHHFSLYEEIWDQAANGEKVFSHRSYFNHWYVNAETKEVIPYKIFNEEAEEDEIYLIFNEKYSEIGEKYSTYEGD